MQNAFLHFLMMLRRLFGDQILLFCSILFSMFEKSWKYGNDLFTCFVDLKKVYDHLSNCGGLCMRLALMVSCYMPLSHSMMPTGILW